MNIGDMNSKKSTLSKHPKQPTLDRWISRAEKIIKLIRPKYHNYITRIVVGAGLALAFESQFNLLEVFGVAIFEKIFGPSDYLRDLFAGTTYPWTGIVFVVCGLAYHAIVTVGLELIDKYRQAIPPQPKLDMSFINTRDKESFDSKIQLKGKICVLPDSLKVPDNTCYSQYALDRIEEYKESLENQSCGVSSLISNITNPKPQYSINKDYYRERAQFLRIWGGAEIVTLSLCNVGELLCRNIQVRITIPNQTGVSVDNQNDLRPHLPSQETDCSPSPFLSQNPFSHKQEHFDIKQSNTSDEFVFLWEPGDLQAKAKTRSCTKLFVHCEVEMPIDISIFCDELANPIQKRIQLIPAKEILLDSKMLTQDKRDFFLLANSAIMDGYLERECSKFRKEMESQEIQLIP